MKTLKSAIKANFTGRSRDKYNYNNYADKKVYYLNFIAKVIILIITLPTFHSKICFDSTFQGLHYLEFIHE